MAKEFKLPQLGEEVDEGEVLKVLISKGDRVEKDQAVLEIETDKATLEVPVDSSGTVREVKVAAGDRIHVGQVLLVLDEAEGEEETSEEPEPSEEREESEEEEPRAEEEKPPAAAAQEEEKEEEEEERPRRVERVERVEAVEKDHEETPRPSRSRSVPAAPSVRRLARELGIEIQEVEGSGPGGRIGAEDVKRHAREVVAAGGASARATLPDLERWGAVERKRLSGLRRTAARRLSVAWSQVAHVTQHDRADVTEVERLRTAYGNRVEALGGKLTLTAVAIHIVAAALRDFPTFNATLDLAREEVVYKKYRHIGVAVDTERGLLVPVLRNADRMSLADIAVQTSRLAERARSGELGKEDMEGGSFTVTNLGGIGGTSFTPIVNWPEVAILGMSRARREPVWRDGSFEPRLVLPLSLSYDHRLIDGADAARFLRFVAEAFEHPLLLSLGRREGS